MELKNRGRGRAGRLRSSIGLGHWGAGKTSYPDHTHWKRILTFGQSMRPAWALHRPGAGLEARREKGPRASMGLARNGPRLVRKLDIDGPCARKGWSLLSPRYRRIRFRNPPNPRWAGRRARLRSGSSLVNYEEGESANILMGDADLGGVSLWTCLVAAACLGQRHMKKNVECPCTIRLAGAGILGRLWRAVSRPEMWPVDRVVRVRQMRSSAPRLGGGDARKAGLGRIAKPRPQMDGLQRTWREGRGGGARHLCTKRIRATRGPTRASDARRVHGRNAVNTLPRPYSDEVALLYFVDFSNAR